VISFPKQPIVWEVEVEDEVLVKLEGAYVGYLSEDKDSQMLQKQFRMNGFHNLKVCSVAPQFCPNFFLRSQTVLF
jgi:hypothetical protein